VVIVLANRYGGSGALVVYGFAWAVFMVPYAVLAIPIATSAFPELSRHDTGAEGGERAGRGFDLTAAASTRAVMVASWLGAAVLLGAREPIARVFESPSSAATAVLALALAAFAPALIGYGLSANLSRVLYAQRRNRAPALAIAVGWLLVIVADAAIVPLVAPDRVVPVLGLGTTFGLTVSGIALLLLSAASAGARRCAGCRGRSSPASPGASSPRWQAPRWRRSSPARCPRCREAASWPMSVSLCSWPSWSPPCSPRSCSASTEATCGPPCPACAPGRPRDPALGVNRPSA
jgi:Lipid II flippase MurJ